MSKKNRIISAIRNCPCLMRIIQVVITLAIVTGMFFLTLYVFINDLCEDKATCYTVSIFVIGIIVALKIRILDEKDDYYPLLFKKSYYGGVLNNKDFKNNELLYFCLASGFNVLVFISAYISDSQGQEELLKIALNVLICFDFVVLIRNIAIFSRIVFLKDNRRRHKKDILEKDIFESWLEDSKSEYVKRALTDSSFKNVDKTVSDEKTNTELATYGDAIIKYCLCEILLDDVTNISEKKKEYESNEYLVTKVACRYNLLDRIKRDKTKKPNDYNYVSKKSSNNPHKYIATAVEAMVAAIYLETKDMNAIKDLVEEWILLHE